MDHVVALRRENGAFTSIADFAARVDPKLVNKRAFESLARAGAFDALNPNRRQMVESSEILLNSAARKAQERESGQTSLFGGAAQSSEEVRLPAVAEWPAHERLSEEFSAMGFYLSGHPLDSYGTALTRLQAVSYAQLMEDRRSASQPTLAGTVVRKSERRGRNDQNYAFVSFSDATGMYEVMFFPEVLTASRPLLEAGKSVLLKVSATWEGEELKLRALWVKDLDIEAANAGEGLRVRLDDAAALGAIAGHLRQPGKGIITLVVPGAAGEEVEIALPSRQQVSIAMKDAIRALPGVVTIESV
jgi:DNA polymerase III subunit alpha